MDFIPVSSCQYTQLACGQGQSYEHNVGKVLHLVACTKNIAYSKLKVGWSVVIHTVSVLQLVRCHDQKPENQFHKDWYREWLALHRILAGNITITITCLEPLLNSMPFQVLKLSLHLKQVLFLGLVLPVTSKKYMNKRIKHQKCKKKYRNRTPKRMQTRQG